MADGGTELVNFICFQCDKKNIKKEADIYCVECQDYYCSPCTDLHKMFPLMSTHQFIDKSSFNTVILQKALPEKCEAHKTELLDMYCADHDDVAFVTCIAIKHRRCQHIHSIPGDVDNLCKEIDADKTNSELIRIKTKIEEAERAKKLLIKELNVQKEKATESIRQFRKEIEEILDTFEKATLKSLEEKYKNSKEKLGNEIKNLHRHIDELKLSSQKLTKSVGNKVQEFVAVKTSRKQIIEATEAEAQSVTKSSDIKVEFIADSTIKDVLKDFKTFGLIAVSINTENLRDKMYIVKRKKQVNIKHVNDLRQCSVNGSCFIDNELLFLTDYVNNTLKLINLSSESIKDQLNLEAAPMKICQISTNDFAVSLTNQTIQFVTIGNKLYTTKQLKLDHHCYGLAYKDNKLFISDSGSALFIYDMNGTLLKKITTDGQGNEIFNANRDISVSSDGNMIYVANYNILIVFDLEGNFKATITDPNVINPIGVCTDKRGNIFMCGWYESKIVQINEKTSKILGIFGNVLNSTSCAFHLKHNRLAVTIHNSDTVDVYDLLYIQ